MGLREGDTAEKIEGRIIWVIGRSGSGKSTLIDAVRLARGNIITLDDHLRVRAGILGASMRAYDSMIGLSWAIAFQGFDVMLPCGGQSRELRDYIRSEIPMVRFVYIAERGRHFEGYEEPQGDENILTLAGGTSTAEEVRIVTEDIWKPQFINSSET
jgi:energy-coupling factor transporter ATP-binding protein EcfA2